MISINEDNKEETIVKISSPRSPRTRQIHTKSPTKSPVHSPSSPKSPERWVDEDDLKLNLNLNGPVNNSEEETDSSKQIDIKQ